METAENTAKKNMRTRTRIDNVIAITFLVAVIGIIYFVTSLFLLGSDPTLTGLPESYMSWMVTERFVLLGMLVVILIIMTYVLMEQKKLEQSSASQTAAKSWRNEKDVRGDIMRYYRDMGALKIVLKDGVMDAKSYNERKKYLEEMIKKRKKQLQDIRTSVDSKKQSEVK
jgi:uncharacterized membrane protein